MCAEKHRGFAFVQFEDRGDAADAIDNMNNAELFGRVLKVNVAKPSAAVGGHRPGARLSPPPPALATLAPLEPCVRVHPQCGSRKPTRTTRTRKGRATAATPRARRGPHEPMACCWVHYIHVGLLCDCVRVLIATRFNVQGSRQGGRGEGR